MQETNLFLAGVPPRTVLGELTAHPDLLAGGEGLVAFLARAGFKGGGKLAHGFHGPWLPQKIVKNIT